MAGASRDPNLLADSDTVGILRGIEERGNPFSWFASDWPLANHFYRPVSTLAFEIDYAWHGMNARGFAWTNAFLVAALLPSLYALGRRIFNPVLALAPVVLFTYWVIEGPLMVPVEVGLVTCALLALGSLRKKDWSTGLLVFVAGWVACAWLAGMEPLRFRMMDWIPGRTASVMAVFAMPALVLAWRALEKKCLWGAGLASVCFWLALSSYEQAVMMPFVFAVLVWGFSIKGKVAHWIIPSLVLLIAYVAVRVAFVPTGVSRYHDQQFRSMGSAWLPIADYVAPWTRAFPSLGLASEPMEWLVGPLFPMLTEAALWLASWWVIHRAGYLRKAVACVLASVLALLPMSFLHPFSHYHYLPMALMSLYVCLLWQSILEVAKPFTSWQTNSSSEQIATSFETAPDPPLAK